MQNVVLGCKARDKITGFEGIVTGRCEYLFGCGQWGLTPAAKDGECKNTLWIDEGRAEWIGPGVAPESVRAQENGAGDAPQAAHGRL